MSDQVLAEITATPVSTIPEVISVMQRIDELLPNEDGLKWFNLLYLMVTKAVLENPPPAGWADAQWLARLDVIFAGLYFEAVRNRVTNTASVPKSWQVLFDARHRPHIMRVQFALCGMNAHINHDLQFAIVQTCREQNIAPRQNSAQHQDFRYVNNILEAVEPQALQYLAVGKAGVIEESLGRLDNVLTMWGVRKARDTGWAYSEILWHFRNNPIYRKIHVQTVDNVTGFAGHGLIIPLGQ
jgi:hypothetical protein